ncbi:MAG TPA: hypothetical protein VH105_03185 [Burkholderiales bacterium]|jgi:hypothetical protein|nr:hypothetical protein [Burkholderiales bacterium]
MTRTLLALCLASQLAACSTIASVSTYFDRGYRIRQENSENVVIEYDTEKFSDVAMLEKASGTCAAYGKSAVFNKSDLESNTGHRVTVYRCLTQSERRDRDAAEKAGEPVPLRRP